ncbi:MAG: DUF1003 domain-containing protein [bacterium]|nr:DUF1003 domain-containing protein [bacterium]
MATKSIIENITNAFTADPESYNSRLRSRRRVVKSFEATANASRSFSERVADRLTLSLGTMTFLICNAVWFLVWIAINTHLVPQVPAFDPFPFGLLTMIVSLEAIFLSIIVLISQNRGSKIDDIRDEIDLQITTIAEEEITKIMELQVMLLNKQGIDVSKDKELQKMLRPTDTTHIEVELEKQFK